MWYESSGPTQYMARVLYMNSQRVRCRMDIAFNILTRIGEEISTEETGIRKVERVIHSPETKQEAANVWEIHLGELLS